MAIAFKSLPHRLLSVRQEEKLNLKKMFPPATSTRCSKIELIIKTFVPFWILNVLTMRKWSGSHYLCFTCHMVVIIADPQSLMIRDAFYKCNTSTVIRHYIYLTALPSLWVLYKWHKIVVRIYQCPESQLTFQYDVSFPTDINSLPESIGWKSWEKDNKGCFKKKWNKNNNN